MRSIKLIQVGERYWFRFAGLPERQIEVKAMYPPINPDLYFCADLETDEVVVLTEDDLLQSCEDQTAMS